VPRRARAPRFVLTFGLEVEEDLTDLNAFDPTVLDAAQTVLDDLAARVKFDHPDQRPQRFRLVYQQVDDARRDVIAIGRRDDHPIYRAAANRLAP
jgi:hypothetical protein